MRILFTTIFNALILFALGYLLPFREGVQEGIMMSGNPWIVYGIGGCILGLLNTFVRPVLKFLGFPLTIATFGFFLFIINGIILWLFQFIFMKMNLPNVTYTIIGVWYFVFAVVIFTFLNTLTTILL